jgi:drug/metabolite transporter (DMT)-like permease
LLSLLVFWLCKTVRLVKIEVSLKDFFVKNPRSSAIQSVLLTAIFEPVLYMLFETLGVSMTTGITAGVILSLGAITTCIVEAIVLKERATLLQKIFLGLGIVGAIYIAVNTNTSDGQNSVLGIVFLFLTILAGSLFCAFSRKSSKSFSAMEITYVSCMLGAIAFNSVNVVRHLVAGDILHYFDPFFNVENLIGFAFLGIASTIIATAMNNFALARMQASTMAAFGGISTLVTVAVGVIFANERLYLYHVIGLSLIVIRMVGVSAIAIRREKKERAHAATNESD